MAERSFTDPVDDGLVAEPRPGMYTADTVISTQMPRRYNEYVLVLVGAVAGGVVTGLFCFAFVLLAG